MMKGILTLLAAGLLSAASVHAKDIRTLSLQSPNKKLKATVAINDSVTYSVQFGNDLILKPSTISMHLDKIVLGKNGTVSNVRTQTVNENIRPVYGKFAQVNDNYNELAIDFGKDYTIIFRAYNEGVAYRFVTRLKDSLNVLSEQADFQLANPKSAIVAETDNYTAWELAYTYPAFDEVSDTKHTITPALFTQTNDTRVVVAESDVLDYPGMYLTRNGAKMHGVWANYPSQTKMGSWGDFVSVVTERTPYVAKTVGTRNFPWRIVMVTNDDKSLLTNNLIYKLATPQQIKNTSWIKPGKAAWEWWHDAILPGADIPSGMDNRSTQLYNFYVDFAAKNNLEFLMIDAGWSNVYDIQKPNEKVDIHNIINHAKSKNVGVFLWVVASSLLKDLDGNMDYLKNLGAVGLKVDFFDRDDQLAIESMEKIAKAAADRQLMINFHGCTKPTGMERAYPNIVNYEAVRGQECSKWDTTPNPQHHMTFVFTRMLAGPLDYTPGGMRSKTKAEFKPIDPGLPSVMGTRVHQLAMYVLYDQAFAMLCDAPTEYEKYPDVLRFLSVVPTSFDDTKVLDAKVGEYAVMAKRKGESWYLGGMTNWTERDVKVAFDFLPKGKTFIAEIYTDGANANTDPNQYNYKKVTVTSKTVLPIHLSTGGGVAMYIHDAKK